jgi:hypothetical protein
VSKQQRKLQANRIQQQGDVTVLTYSGDTFKKLIRAYSNDRMSLDRTYRNDVLRSMDERRRERAKHQRAAA